MRACTQTSKHYHLTTSLPSSLQVLEQYQFCYDAAVDFLHSSDMLLHFHQCSMGSTTSIRSRKSRTSSPSRNDSSLKPPANRTSSRNFELNRNSGSHIYGGSSYQYLWYTAHTFVPHFSGSLNSCSGSPQNGPDQRATQGPQTSVVKPSFPQTDHSDGRRCKLIPSDVYFSCFSFVFLVS